MNELSAELKNKLERLEIAVGQGEDGRWTAISDSEPAFCFVSESESKLAEFVADTITSYAKVFFNTQVTAVIQTSDVREIPVKVFRPNRRFSPSLQASFAAA